jgi:hypothetical protein
MEARLACADGKLDSARVDEELALSFVFPRCEIERCTEAPRGVDMRTAAWGACAAKDTYGVFFGLVPGSTYWALVREHPEEAAKAEAARALLAAAQRRCWLPRCVRCCASCARSLPATLPWRWSACLCRCLTKKWPWPQRPLQPPRLRRQPSRQPQPLRCRRNLAL